MLNILRKRAQSPLIQAVVLVIVVVFVFWGVGTNMTRNRNSVATVNGEEISLLEFQRTYEREVENLRQRFGGQLPPDLLENAGFKQQVLGRMIRDALLGQGGRDMGIMVTDRMTQQKIGTMEVFQENGQFNLGRYREILAQNRMTPTSFETGLKSDLLSTKTGTAVASFAYVSDLELAAWQGFQDEAVKLSYLGLDGKDFEDKVQVDEAGLEGWFESHRDDYRLEAQRRLKYLYFPADSEQAEKNIDEESIRSYYEEHASTYQVPEQRHARHILFKVGPDDDEAAKAEKREQALEVLAQAKAGKDFAELAREYSEGPSRDSGGDLGFFSRGSMVKPFEEAVFSLQPGEISDLVETRFGYHIIKLLEIRPGSSKSLDEVRQEIRATLAKQQAESESFKKASDAYEQIMRAGSLDAFADQSGMEIMQTDYFRRSNPPGEKKILSDPAFLSQAFDLNKGELSSVFQVQGGYAILFVDDIKEASLPELAAVRARVEKDYRRAQGIELAREAAEAALAAARESGTLNPPADYSGTMLQTGFVKRSELNARRDGLPVAVFKEAFSLPWSKKLPDHPLVSGNTFYIYQVVERKEGIEKADAERQQSLRKRLIALARTRMMNQWLATLQQQADIWINERLLQ